MGIRRCAGLIGFMGFALLAQEATVAPEASVEVSPQDKREVLIRYLCEARHGYQKALALTEEQAPAGFKAWASKPFQKGDVGEEISVDIKEVQYLVLLTEATRNEAQGYWGRAELLDDAGRCTRLADLEPLLGLTEGFPLRLCKEGQTVFSIGRERIKHGILTSASSYVIYPLHGKYKTFRAYVGASSSGQEGQPVTLRVQAGLTPPQLERLKKTRAGVDGFNGNMRELSATLLSESFIDAGAWIRCPDSRLSHRAVTGLLKTPGCALPELVSRLEQLSKEKASSDADWLRLYFDALDVRSQVLACETAVEQVDAVAEFLTEEGVSLAPFQKEMESLKEVAAKAKAEGLTSFKAMLPVLASFRRKMLLTHPGLQFDELLVDVRPLPLYYHNVDQYKGSNSRKGPGLLILKNWKADKPVERWLTKGKLPEGSTQHPDLSYDGKRVIFSFCDHTETNAINRRFLVYEAMVDGSGIRKVTGTAKDPWEKTRRDDNYTVIIEDFDPHYLPDGGFVFTSTRSQNIARCHGGRNAPSFLIYRGTLDGTEIRALSWGEANELDPAVLNDGRIIYNRWEYVNRHDCKFHKLWTMKPDGTGAANFYGNLTPKPLSITEPRAIPGSGKVMATATAHHSFTAGSIILVDPTKGVEGDAPILKLTPEARYPEAEGLQTATYASPYPITERLFFASWNQGPHLNQGNSPEKEEHIGQNEKARVNTYALYLVFHHKGKAYREHIYTPEGKHMSCFTPLPVRKRAVPPAMTSSLPVSPKERTGTFMVQNVYESQHKLEPGSIKYIRINPLFNQPTPLAPMRSWIINEVAKGVLGTVPVNADGSVAFTIPSRTPVQLQLLDAEKMCVMNMRTFIYLQDGEQVSCTGCHEDRMRSPLPTSYSLKGIKTPQPVPGPDATRGFNFVASVQPVFDRYCIRCHGLEKREGGVDMTRRTIEKAHFFGARPLPMPVSYATIVTNKAFFTPMERNYESNASVPKDYLSHACGFPTFLKKHCLAKKISLDAASWERVITWLDVNAQLFGNYSFNRLENRMISKAGEQALREHIQKQFGADVAKQPFETLVNSGAPEESRILKMPLSVKAGGWGQVTGWKETSETSYQKMLRLVQGSLEPLPFADVHGTCGCPNACKCKSCRVREVDDAYILRQRSQR